MTLWELEAVSLYDLNDRHIPILIDAMRRRIELDGCRGFGTGLALILLMRRFLFPLLIIVSTSAIAQVSAPAEEEIVLDDAEKRIVETDYRAARAVSAHGSEAGGWQVYAGAAIEARRIDLTLRNVKGVVRFRSDWSALNELFARSERRRLTSAIR